MNVVFMGTPEFAAEALRAIIAHGDNVSLVVTRADKPKGRGYAVTQSPVKELAIENGIPVITPATLRDAEVQNRLMQEDADVFIVAAYGRILPKEVLCMPKFGCVNIHASLLPKLRGAAPINRAVMNGDTKGGITIMYMDEGVDTGDIILQEEIDIPDDMNAGEYHDAMAALGARLICRYLDMAKEGNVPRTKQQGDFTYADKIEKAELHIGFSSDANEVYNKIRGLAPAPCGFAMLKGRRIKLHAARRGSGSGDAGCVISTDGGIEVACADGSVIITMLQPEGKQVMTAEQFLRGNKIPVGEQLQ